MTTSLIRVGNSKAVIIPAKLLRKLNIDEDTELTLNEESGAIKIAKSQVSVEKLNFPKVVLSQRNEKVEAIFSHLVTIPQEDIDKDERLAYILQR